MSPAGPGAPPAPTEVDVIVVGGGTAGSVMAARLSEDPWRRVLVLEAGRDYRSAETAPAIRGPNFSEAVATGSYHWPSVRARFTEWQAATPYLCGRGTGGSSAINGQGAVRPGRGDVDAWGLGTSGWGWEEVLPTFIAMEHDADFGTEPYHGDCGPVPVTRTARAAWGAVSRGFEEAATAFGHPSVPDLNAPDTTGVAPATWHRRSGQRVSANDSYLEGARSRPNLDVVGHLQVDRVLFDHGRVVGVAARASRRGRGGADEAQTLRAETVVLCAGAVHSPAILQRSGVGPAPLLHRHGIPVVADVASVGANLQDHPAFWLVLPLREPARCAGVDTLPGHCVLRLSSGVAGAEAEDLEAHPLDRAPHHVGAGGVIVALMECRSRGTVTLTSPDPRAQPAIEFRSLSESGDALRLRRGVRLVIEICRHRSVASLSEAGLSASAGGSTPLADVTDRDLDGLLRAGCFPFHHAAGTCRMGADADAAGVVDAAGRVAGVEGLRVADASIIPTLGKTPTYLMTIMVAERIAERMRHGG